jgi:hypothetical protein
MLKTKSFIISAILGLSMLPVSAISLSEVEIPKAPAYRVGLSELPETQYVQAALEKNKPEKTYAQIDNSQEGNVADLTYADLSIKRLSKEISQDLEFEEQDMMSDLSLLWQGAAMQSDTINFALYKLANPDADKPDEKSLKKVLTTIAGMSTLVGAGVGSPILAGSSLIGGNILGIMSQDTKALNYKYTKVNDADMIILIRKVEDLQQKTVDLYYDYMSAKKQLAFANDLVEERQHKFSLAQENNAPRELIVITDAYYRTAMDKQRIAKSDFFSKRAALEQFVGNETFVQFENELTARENGETKDNETVQKEYESTITNVENFTNSQNEQPEILNTTPHQLQLRGYDKQDEELENSEIDISSIENDNVITGSSSNIENDEKSSKKVKKEKTKKTKEVKEKKSKKEKVKVDKHSTKGLIFLHGQDKSTINNSSVQNANYQTTTSTTQEYTQTTQQVTKPTVDNFGLPPLDEIKVPELTKGGYSIHSDYYGETNSGYDSL